MKKDFGFENPLRHWRRVAFGIGVGLVMMLALTGGFAWLAHQGHMGREYMGLASAAILALSSLTGALSAGRGEGRLARCAAVGGGILLILLLINLALFDGSLSGLLPGALVIAGGAGAAALLGGSGGRRGKYRYPKYSNR